MQFLREKYANGVTSAQDLLNQAMKYIKDNWWNILSDDMSDGKF